MQILLLLYKEFEYFGTGGWGNPRTNPPETLRDARILPEAMWEVLSSLTGGLGFGNVAEMHSTLQVGLSQLALQGPSVEGTPWEQLCLHQNWTFYFGIHQPTCLQRISWCESPLPFQETRSQISYASQCSVSLEKKSGSISKSLLKVF